MRGGPHDGCHPIEGQHVERLRGRDSNPDFTDQNRTNCHYSTPQRVGIRITVCDRLLCYVGGVIEIRRTALLLLLVSSGVLFAVGCGGSNDSTETAAPATTTTSDETATITKDELISQGDDICTSVNAAVGTIDSSTSADESLKASQISQIYNGLSEDLSALGTPTDGAAPTDVIDAANALASAQSDGGDTTAAASTLATAAAEYGFTECAAAPEAPAGTNSATDPDTSTSSPSTSVPATPTEPAPAAPTEPAPAAPAPPTGGGAAVPPSGGSSPGSGGTGGISPG